MAGRVIQALRSSFLAAALTEAELRALAGCGRIESFDAGAPIIAPHGADDRIFVLREGEVELRLWMTSNGSDCNGEATIDLATPGATFGWGRWVRPDRITVAATTRAPSTFAVFDLTRLVDPETLLKTTRGMLALLYSQLQKGGICPPDIRGLLKWEHSLRRA